MSDYVLPAFLATVVHLGVVAAVAFAWSPDVSRRTLITPPSVAVTLVQLKPEAPAPRAAPSPQVATPSPPPTPVAQPKPVQQPKPKPNPEPAEAVQQPSPELAPPPVVDERRETRQRLAQEALELALANESEALQAQQAARTAAELADSYAARISRAIEKNWTRPPSARNGMRADLLISLVPTGEVVAVNVAQSSGDAAFDRSAERAVQRLGKLEVPEDSKIFEEYFRRLRLTFQPEDLMR